MIRRYGTLVSMDNVLRSILRRPLIPAFVSGLLLIAAFASGFYIGEIGALENSAASAGSGIKDGAPVGVDPAPLWKAWKILDEKFVSASTTAPAVSDEEKLWGAIQGLTQSLKDPYTVFLPPSETEIFEEDISGNFEGVGMEIGSRDGVLTVIAPLKGTPAERAGLQSGDRIIRIDGVLTDTLTVERAVRLIRGPRGTSVSFTISREGVDELIEVSVTRDVIEIPTIDTEFKKGASAETGGGEVGRLRADGVFVIALHNFSAISPGLFRNALREFVESGTNKLLLDLRNNPGGFLEAAVEIASWFLPAGKIIVTEDFGINAEPRVHRSRGYDVFNENLRMVILVNRGSASASEILAGALREYGIATVIGERTFGKGSVQELVKITPETSLKVTVARWVTPKGTSISEAGLVPDIEVPLSSQDREKGKDPQLERAVQFLLSGS